MKRVEIEKIPIYLPEKIDKICLGARIYDSSCSPEARVYFIDRDGGYYLKSGAVGSLAKEARMTEYFSKKGLGAEVISYVSGDVDLLLTRAVMGEDCTHRTYLDDPKRICDSLAENLRMLHETEASDCPRKDCVSEYIARAKENYLSDRYNKEHFPDSFGFRSGQEAWEVLSVGAKEIKNEVLIHGDYCLPNVMLNNWKFSGFIDLGQAGIGDRHIDLFWGRWSIGFNLSLVGRGDGEKYGERFLDAYGRDKVDSYKMKIISAAEVFS